MEEPIKKKVYKKSTIIQKNTEKVADKESHYVNREAFYQELVARDKAVKEAKASGKELPRVSNFIGKCLIDIANGLAKKYQFNGYSFREEMVADAIVHCLKYIDSFDISVSTNPFAYFSQSCYYQFLARIQLEKTQQYVKYSRLLDSASLNEVSESPDSYSSFDIDMTELDTSHMSEFVSNYDKAIQRAAAKKPKRKSNMITLDNIPDEPIELTEFVEDEIQQDVLRDIIEQQKKVELID